MAQFLRPINDRTITGTWTTETGGTTDLYTSINETTLNTSTYIETGNNPGGTDLYETGLSSGSTPVSGNHILRYTVGKSATSGRIMNSVVRLFNSNDTEIASWTHNNIDDIVTYTQTLTSGQVANINNYVGLYVRTNPTTSGGGASRRGRTYWTEFEIPDATATPTKQIKVGSDWKEIDDIKVKIGTWKDVSTIYKKIDGSWKESQ